MPDRFFVASGNELAQYNQDTLHFRRAACYSQLKSKVGNILAKATAMCVNLKIDDAPIASRSHSHPSHLIHPSQTSRLLSTCLSFAIPYPLSTYCVRDFSILQLYLLVSHNTDTLFLFYKRQSDQDAKPHCPQQFAHSKRQRNVMAPACLLIPTKSSFGD